MKLRCGILIMIGFCLAALTACLAASTDMQTLPPTTFTLPPSAMLTRPPSTPTQTPRPIPTRPTPLPYSDFSITVAITMTATDLKVGDIITISLKVTNTGKLYFHRAYGTLHIFLENGKDYQPSSNPILECMTPKLVDFALPGYNLKPGESVSVTFVLRAMRPGAVVIVGETGGEVYLIPGRAVGTGGNTAPTKIHVQPNKP